MAEFFNRANLLQGSVSPVAGGNVSVPMDDPNNKLLAQGFGSLASRLDAFKTTAFNVAGERAKAAGAAYGVRNAPTVEQVELAKRTGQPIDLPGDPSSLKIYDQAAYDGSLAVTESQFTSAGRRALTDAMALAAQDPNIKPTEFAGRMDTIVSEYSNMMGQISPTSGAKIAATLSTTANGQLVSFSRSFATQQKKELKNSAYQDFDIMVDTLVTTIDGFQPGETTPDGQPTATLDQIIASKRLEAENILINGGESQKTVMTKMGTVFDKAVLEAKRGVVLNWAQSGDYADDPSEAYDDLGDGTAGKRIAEIFGSMTQTEQAKLRKEILSIATQKFNLEKQREDDVNEDNDRVVKKLMSELNTLREEGKPAAFRAKLKELNTLSPKDAAAFYNDNDFGLGGIDDQVAISELERDIDNFDYDRGVQSGDKDPLLGRLLLLKTANNVTSTTYKRLRTAIIDRNKEDLNLALLTAQDAFNYVPRDNMAMDPGSDRDLGRQNYKKAELQIKRAFRKDPEIDLDDKMNTIIQTIRKADQENITFESLTSKLPPNINTLEKINKVKGNKKFQSLLMQYQGTIKKLKDKFPDQWNATK